MIMIDIALRPSAKSQSTLTTVSGHSRRRTSRRSADEVDFTNCIPLLIFVLSLAIEGVQGARNAQWRHSSTRQAAVADVPPENFYDYGDDFETQYPTQIDRSIPKSFHDYSLGMAGDRSMAIAAADSGGPVSAPVTIKCYSCDYLKDWNHGQGLTSCLDPFVPDNIPTVDCTGPCAKIYRKLEGGKDDYFMSRNCMPNCKEMMRSSRTSSYSECCSHSFCNSAPASRTFPLLVVASLTSFACILLFCY